MVDNNKESEDGLPDPVLHIKVNVGSKVLQMPEFNNKPWEACRCQTNRGL